MERDSPQIYWGVNCAFCRYLVWTATSRLGHVEVKLCRTFLDRVRGNENEFKFWRDL